MVAGKPSSPGVCVQTAAWAEAMATEKPGSSGEADLIAASEGVGADPSPSGSLQDASAAAPADSEVRKSLHTLRRKTRISIVCVASVADRTKPWRRKGS